MLRLSWFLAYKRKKLGHLKGEFERVREVLLEAKKKILWVETLKGKSLLGRSVLGLEEEEEGDLKRINRFHQQSSPIFLPFLIFYGCFSPLHKLISFSRVFDVV